LIYRRLLTLLLLLASNIAVSAGYKDDDATWLVYDKKYRYYFLLKVQTETYMTGRADIVASDNYRRARFDGDRRASKVSFLSGGLQVRTRGDNLEGIYNADRSEVEGEFIGETGGSFTATLIGHVDEQVSLFHVCSTEDSENPYQCTDIGKREFCRGVPSKYWRSYRSESECSQALQGKAANTNLPPRTPVPLRDFTANSARGWDMSACDPIVKSSNETGKQVTVSFFNDLFEDVYAVWVKSDASMKLLGSIQVGEALPISISVGYSVAFFTKGSNACVLDGRIDASDEGKVHNIGELIENYESPQKHRGNNSAKYGKKGHETGTGESEVVVACPYDWELAHYQSTKPQASLDTLQVCLEGLTAEIGREEFPHLLASFNADLSLIAKLNGNLRGLNPCESIDDYEISKARYASSRLNLRGTVLLDRITANDVLRGYDLREYKKWVFEAQELYSELTAIENEAKMICNSVSLSP
jgi:hypothetical protein